MRAGIDYTRRWLNYVIEDMSRDEAQTYFLGNPGYGIASDFPKATRNYDAVTFSLHRAFRQNWQATSATRSRGCAATSPAFSGRNRASSIPTSTPTSTFAA